MLTHTLPSQKMQSTNASIAANGPSRTINLKSALQENKLFQAQLKHVSNNVQCFPSSSGVNTVPKIPTVITPLPEAVFLKTPYTSANRSGEVHPQPAQETSRRHGLFSKMLTAVRNLWTTYLSPCFSWTSRLSNVKDNAQDNVKANINLNHLIEFFTKNFDYFLGSGIFRVPGGASGIKKINETLLTRGTLNAEELPAVNDMCTVIKRTLLQAMSNDDKNLMSANLKCFIKEENKENPEFLKAMRLPEALKTILPLLVQLTLDDNVKITKMDASNLAVCFAPNCFPVQLGSNAIADTQSGIILIQKLIESSRV